jgi:hypothetical protein
VYIWSFSIIFPSARSCGWCSLLLSLLKIGTLMQNNKQTPWSESASELYYTILYCTILYYIILYYTLMRQPKFATFRCTCWTYKVGLRTQVLLSRVLYQGGTVLDPCACSVFFFLWNLAVAWLGPPCESNFCSRSWPIRPKHNSVYNCNKENKIEQQLKLHVHGNLYWKFWNPKFVFRKQVLLNSLCKIRFFN